MNEAHATAPLEDGVFDDAWVRARLEEWEAADAFSSPVEDLELDAPSGVLPWAVSSGVDHDVALDRLEAVAKSARLATATQYDAVRRMLRDAAELPDPWVGPDPTLDPLWEDPTNRRRSVSAIRRARRDFAVRAVVAGIAVRLRLSEVTVRSRAHCADVLFERCPRLWAAFQAGGVDERNATSAAEFADSLPVDAPEAWAVFDEAVTAVAGVLTPAKFRTRARDARERSHSEHIDERFRRAADRRAVWLSAEIDGMATLSLFLPAAIAGRRR